MMRVAIGGDHGGWRLKEEIIALLQQKGIAYRDFGAFSPEAVDYPDFALKVAEAVRSGEYDRGILCCGTGIGVAIAANKVPGIRAALCHDTFSARAAREHNNANILTLGERVIGPGLAKEIVETWLKAEFQGGRHARRVEKITRIEEKYCAGRSKGPETEEWVGRHKGPEAQSEEGTT
ncbi:MAG: ribose 5-phosphate isomerase B [Armatimonadetes bacterium]|nr:ribose 5-phosphate isomerase B [Armatimonadota bacterium]